MEPEALQTVLEQAGPLSVVVALTLGALLSYNPVVAASVPVVLAYVARAAHPRRARALAVAFAGGMVMAHVAVGVAAAVGGNWAQQLLGRQWLVIVGPLLVVLGLWWPGWLNLRIPWPGLRGRKAHGLVGAFFLGMPFSLAICPYCVPPLFVLLAVTAASGSVPLGIALWGAYGVGRAAMVLLVSGGMHWMLGRGATTRRVIEVAGGLILIAAGFYLTADYLVRV